MALIKRFKDIFRQCTEHVYAKACVFVV